MMEYAAPPTPEQLAALGERMGVRLDLGARLMGGLGCTMDVLNTDSPDQPQVVLRRYGPWWAERGVDIARREFLVLERVRAADVPAPEPLSIDDAGIFEGPALVISFVEGRSGVAALDDPMGAAEQLATTLALIHETPVDSVLRTQLPQGPPEAVENDVPHGFFEHPLASALLAKVHELRAEATVEDSTLIHGDLWPGNTLWRGRRLAAVVDWEEAAIGDPITDLAYCALDFRYLGHDAAADHFVERYRAVTGTSLSTFALWTASALLRPMPDIAQWVPAWVQLGHPDVDVDRLRSRHSELVRDALNV